MSSIDQARIFERDDLHFSVLTTRARPVRSPIGPGSCMRMRMRMRMRPESRAVASCPSACGSVGVLRCGRRPPGPRGEKISSQITAQPQVTGHSAQSARRRRRPARSDATPHSTRGRARRAELRETRLEVRSAGVAPAPARIRFFLSLCGIVPFLHFVFKPKRCAEDSAHAHTRRPGTPCPRSAPATSDSVLAVRRAQRPLVTLLRCVPA